MSVLQNHTLLLPSGGYYINSITHEVINPLHLFFKAFIGSCFMYMHTMCLRQTFQITRQPNCYHILVSNVM